MGLLLHFGVPEGCTRPDEEQGNPCQTFLVGKCITETLGICVRFKNICQI